MDEIPDQLLGSFLDVLAHSSISVHQLYIHLKKMKEIKGRRDKMRHFCCLFISVFLLFSSLIPPTTPNFIMHRSPDLIKSTCKQCADISTIFDYNFCVASLQSVPASHAVNLAGLATVSMELALENATSTVTTIEKMIGSKEFDPFAVDCLRDCLELYADAISKVVMAIGAFLSKHFGAANIMLSAVVEETVKCEAGFRQKKGEVTPLVKQNYNLFEISITGLCIVNLVSLEPSLNSWAAKEL